jgi:hypothetical protein
MSFLIFLLSIYLLIVVLSVVHVYEQEKIEPITDHSFIEQCNRKPAKSCCLLAKLNLDQKLGETYVYVLETVDRLSHSEFPAQAKIKPSTDHSFVV